MINPGGIPQIPGNMDALAAHANGLRAAGTGFADTGADVHATWQGLAPAYLAPESEQLLQATRPVTETAGNIGRDVEQVAGALQRYADEVRPIQQHLRDLKAQAEQLVADIHAYENQKPSTSEMAASAKTGIVPDKDWTDDGNLTDRDAQLMSAVNQAVADWMAAQRRCANAITGLYGGTHYTTDNADGHHTRGEYGYSTDQLTAAAGSDQGLPWGRTEDTSNPLSEAGHFVLDLGGLIPGVGEFADGANAAWYAAEGDHLNAGLSAAAMIPFAGWGATGGKLIGKGAKAATEGADDAAETTAKNLDDATASNKVDPPVEANLSDYFSGGVAPRASDLDKYAAAQGWTKTQTPDGPPKYVDENGVTRMTLKAGSGRAPGSGHAHVELRNDQGTRIDPHGEPVTRKSPGNHTPIDWDW